ncbi:MAG: EamA family transporter [Myxococcales bacterium]|nr:EamA family transporter [Myxococcales bacterium]
MNAADRQSRGVLAVLLAATGFSWGFVLAKAIGLPPPTIAVWRMAIGGTALSLVALTRHIPWPKQWAGVLLAGLCFGIHQLLYITASQKTNIAIVALVSALQPVVVALVSHRAVGEIVPRRVLGFCVVAVLGVAVVVLSSLKSREHDYLGDLLSLLNLLAVSAYLLFGKRARLEGAPTLTLTASVFFIGLCVALPFVSTVTARSPQASKQWFLLAILALGPGNGHLLVNWAHGRVSAALVAIVLTAVPLLASVWAALILGESYGIGHVIGTLIVVVAVEGARRAEASAAERRSSEASARTLSG